jgi:hypothetical protein
MTDKQGESAADEDVTLRNIGEGPVTTARVDEAS